MEPDDYDPDLLSQAPTHPQATVLTNGQRLWAGFQIGSLFGWPVLIIVLNPAYGHFLLQHSWLPWACVLLMILHAAALLGQMLLLNSSLPPSQENANKRILWSWMIGLGTVLLLYLPTLFLIVIGPAAIQIHEMFRTLNQ